MYDAFNMRFTEEIPTLSSSDTPTAAIKDDEIEEYKNQLVFEAISGRHETIADKDTIETPAIIRKEHRSQFTGIGSTKLELCRFSIQHHQDSHNGNFPDRIYISRRTYQILMVEMEYIYGKSFNGKLPLSITLHYRKVIHIMINDTISDNTSICIHWTLNEYYKSA